MSISSFFWVSDNYEPIYKQRLLTNKTPGFSETGPDDIEEVQVSKREFLVKNDREFYGAKEVERKGTLLSNIFVDMESPNNPLVRGR